jgi:multiple sugar transport system substrate-binding protein
MKNNVFRIAIRKYGPFEVAIQKQFAEFKKRTGCQLALETESLDLNPLHESLFEKKGLKNGNWDVAFINTDWLAEAVAQDALLNLAPYMSKFALPDYPQGWSSTHLQAQQFGESIYGVPYHNGPECLIYRRDLFEDENSKKNFRLKFGYDLTAPKTWDQFRDVARFFTRPAENLYGTIFAAYPDGHNTVYDFCLHLWSRGGELFDAEGQIELNTVQAQNALDFYRQMAADPTAAYPDPQTIDSVKSGALFNEGKIAMMVNWFGFAAACELPSSPVRGKVAIAKIPMGAGGRTTSLSVYWLLAIGSGSAHSEEAYRFLQWVASPEMDKVTTLEGAIGCRLSTWNDPQVNEAVPHYKALGNLSKNARTLPRSQQFPKLAHILDDVITKSLSTNESSASLLIEAQVKASRLKL